MSAWLERVTARKEQIIKLTNQLEDAIKSLDNEKIVCVIKKMDELGFDHEFISWIIDDIERRVLLC